MKPIQLGITLDGESISGLAEPFELVLKRILPVIVEESMQRFSGRLLHKDDSKQNCEPPPKAPTGVEVSPMDRATARELRAAYLLGKLPDDGALLVDTKQVSKLLNVSARTISRLTDTKAMPEPIRMGKKIQWRIREIIEWVESGCPPQKYWQYSEGRGTYSKRR